MDRDKAARKSFGAKTWTGLEQMVEDYAREAVLIARHDFHESLDAALAPAQKVERLDRILNRLSPAPEPLPAVDSDWMTLLWGSYFGELLRREHGGAWAMTVYPRSDFSVPTLEIEGSHLYPMMKVHRRLAMGAGESLPVFYAMLAGRLGQSPGRSKL